MGKQPKSRRLLKNPDKLTGGPVGGQVACKFVD
jgi:hypothetical protein